MQDCILIVGLIFSFTHKYIILCVYPLPQTVKLMLHIPSQQTDSKKMCIWPRRFRHFLTLTSDYDFNRLFISCLIFKLIHCAKVMPESAILFITFAKCSMLSFEKQIAFPLKYSFSIKVNFNHSHVLNVKQ